MQEGNRKESKPMASEVIRVARQAEALEIYLMIEEAIEQGKDLQEFKELLRARIQGK